MKNNRKSRLGHHTRVRRFMVAAYGKAHVGWRDGKILSPPVPPVWNMWREMAFNTPWTTLKHGQSVPNLPSDNINQSKLQFLLSNQNHWKKNQIKAHSVLFNH